MLYYYTYSINKAKSELIQTQVSLIYFYTCLILQICDSTISTSEFQVTPSGLGDLAIMCKL